MPFNSYEEYESQCSSGWSKIFNDFNEALYKEKLSARQHEIVQFIFRETIGWKKIESNITSAQISEEIGLRVDNVTREIARLVIRKIILLKGGCSIGINFDLHQWQLEKDKTPKPKKAVIAKIAPTAKAEPKPKAARRVTPEWFKEFWRIYPAYRRGGNHAFGWKKWQTLGLTEDDASKAKEWLLAAAKVDPAWAHDATSGYALGLARFINESHWRTPVPARKTLSGPNRKEPDFKDDGAKIDYSKGLDQDDLNDNPIPF